MKKALMIASVASMIQQFNMRNICMLQEQGFQVDVACNMEVGSSISTEKIAKMNQQLSGAGVRTVHIPIPRKITSLGSIFHSIRQCRLLMNKNQYALIHCHSPIGGMICRIAHRLSTNYHEGKLIYTAHGFHFFRGAPLKNWLMFYPVEKLCALCTDLLITINMEDYALAKKKMPAAQIRYIPGIGVDTDHFSMDRSCRFEKCRELGIPQNAHVLLSVGELNENKNHEVVVKALSKMFRTDVHYVIAGQGSRQNYLQSLAQELGIADRVHLLGYRDDVAQLYAIADVFAFPSFREGLSVSMMEAMAFGLPIVCSKIRGNTDLIQHESGGYHVSPTDVDAFASYFHRLLEDDKLRLRMGAFNQERIQLFSRKTVDEQMNQIYLSIS